ncbi:glycosyltransferase family 2 protein [Parafrankia discariae]|uniref:glycosyltransferase family 2 protein n=1 Tax=Parafrankia discariae TaxID=365528 RepID=UPI000371CAF3|nr:hypothetical protein [Parafrankia discariae]
MNLWAMACCHRPDIPQMAATLAHMGMPADRVVIVANGPHPPAAADFPSARVVHYRSPGYNMSRWWNTGFDTIAELDPGPREIFVFNADTTADLDTVTRLATALREHDLTAAGPDQHGQFPNGEVFINRQPAPIDLYRRLPGYAFVIAGEHDLRCDPQFRHWWLDDDLEWQARSRRGTGIVGGTRVAHPPNGNPLSPTLTRWADEDRKKFLKKWGATSW